MDDYDNYQNERNVPSAEKLESLSNLFDFALVPKEQRLFIMFILLRGLQMMGRSEVLKLIARIETDTTCDCPCLSEDSVVECDCKCPVCNSEKDAEWQKKSAQLLWEKMKHFAEDCNCEDCQEVRGDGILDKTVGSDDGEWDEVIYEN